MSKEAKRSRRQFSTEQKVAILHRHLVDKVPVSDLCDEYKLQPSVLYQWQQHLLENMVSAFEGAAGTGPSQREKQLAQRSGIWRPNSPAKSTSSVAALCAHVRAAPSGYQKAS
jgi:transposase